MNQSKILYETFNARHFSHADVAETFVSNSDFFEIAKNAHTVILGPRGCGKTTMFKMLTTPALKNWNPKTGKDIELKENIPFIAIYIPSDELWKKQLDSFKESLSHNPEIIKIISNALITTNILSNFCKNIKDHIECTFEKDITKEFEYAQNLIKEWSLPDAANSLSSVRQALESRKNSLIAKIEKAIFYKDQTNKGVDFHESYFLDYIQCIRLACISFERIYNNEKEIKWALCFDELELVSRDFFEELIKKLRIAPPNILFKLSSGPLADVSDSLAQILHDFTIVKMWPYNYDQEPRYQKFCEEIAVQRIRKVMESKNSKKCEDIDMLHIFGDLDYNLLALKNYDFKVNPSAKESEPNSLTWHVFKKLGELDLNFARFLDKNGINPENPVPRVQKHQDTIIRKIKEIVINRLVFMRFDPNNRERVSHSSQTRKVFPIYYGKKTLLNICEGNPRFIIGMLADMFNQVELTENVSELKITPLDQVKLIKDISDRFMAMLYTYPSSQKINNKYYDLEWLITRIGEYFDKEVNKGEVKINPANSFTIDEKLGREFYEILKLGVDLGAFIKLDQEKNIISKDNKLTRYRLSYLIAPQFKLPLRLYAARNLGRILRNEPITIGNQLKLGEGNEN
jgi:hypothetical protein